MECSSLPAIRQCINNPSIARSSRSPSPTVAARERNVRVRELRPGIAARPPVARCDGRTRTLPRSIAHTFSRALPSASNAAAMGPLLCTQLRKEFRIERDVHRVLYALDVLPNGKVESNKNRMCVALDVRHHGRRLRCGCSLLASPSSCVSSTVAC